MEMYVREDKQKTYKECIYDRRKRNSRMIDVVAHVGIKNASRRVEREREGRGEAASRVRRRERPRERVRFLTLVYTSSMCHEGTILSLPAHLVPSSLSATVPKHRVPRCTGELTLDF